MLPVFDSLTKIFLAFVAGVIIGVDRERWGKAAGTRTQMLICVGSAMLSDISIQLPNVVGTAGRMGGDPARLMAQIIAGIGFLGAGVIIKGNKNNVVGITTAATIWVTAAIGIAIGTGFYLPGFFTLLCVLLLSPIAKLEYKLGIKVNPYLLTILPRWEKEAEKYLKELQISCIVVERERRSISIKFFSSAQNSQRLSELLHKKKIAFSMISPND